MRHVVVRACPICPVRRALAGRLEAKLQGDPDLNVERVAGGIGELSVTIDGRPAFRSRGILTAPSFAELLQAVVRALAAFPVER